MSDWAQQTFLGTSLVNWAQIVGGLMALIGAPLIVRQTLKAWRETKIESGNVGNASSLDRAIDWAATVLLVGPSIFSVTKTVSQIAIDKFHPHVLDAAASAAPHVADPVGHVVVHTVTALPDGTEHGPLLDNVDGLGLVKSTVKGAFKLLS